MPYKYSYTSGVSAPYYKEEYAMWIKRTLDVMMVNEDKDYRFSCQKARMRATSIVLKINQAWAWLIDHKDPELKYYALRKRVKIAQEDSFVTLRWKASGLNEAQCNQGEEVNRKYNKFVPARGPGEWRKKLVEFIENAQEGEHYEETSIDMSMVDQEVLASICATAMDIAVVYSNKSGFKVIKHSMLAEKWREEMGF